MAEVTIWYKIYYEDHHPLAHSQPKKVKSCLQMPLVHHWGDFCNAVVIKSNGEFSACDVGIYEDEDQYNQGVPLANRAMTMGEKCLGSEDRPVIVTVANALGNEGLPEIRNMRSIRIPDGIDWDLRSDYFRLPFAVIDGSGVAGKRNEKDLVLYNRKACKEQIDFILERVLRDGEYGLISGLPGTGKSVTSFFVACYLRHEWDIVWIHIPQALYASALVFWIKGNDIKKFRVWAHDAHHFFTRGLRNTLLIIDGFNKNLDLERAAVDWVKCGPNRRLLNVCSFLGSYGDQLMGTARHSVCRWNKDEFHKAIDSDEFWRSVDHSFQGIDSFGSSEMVNDSRRKKLVDLKIFYAGECAKYMFGLSKSQIESMVSENLGRFPEDGFVSMYGFQSSYVARRIGLRYAFSVLQNLLWHELASPTNADPELTLEAVFIARATRGSVCLKSAKGKYIKPWKYPNDFYLVTNEFDPSNLKEMPGDSWMVPMSADQPGYTAVLYIPKTRTIRFVLTAVACTHDVDLAPMAALVQRVQALGNMVKRPEIFFVIPDNGDAKLFKVGAVVGVETFTHLFPSWDDPDKIRKKIKILSMSI